MMLYLRFHNPVSLGLAYQAKKGCKRRSSRLVRLSYMKKLIGLRLASHRRRKLYLEDKFAQKLSFSSLNSLKQWNLRKIMQMFPTKGQFESRSVVPDRSHGSHAILLRKLNTKMEHSKLIDHSLAIQSDYIRPNQDIWVPRTSVEWTIMETSMEDGLMGRAAVSIDRSQKKTQGTDDEISIKQDVSEAETSDMSASTCNAPMQVFAEKLVNMPEPSDSDNHFISLCGRCISTQIVNAFCSDIPVSSSSVDDQSKTQRLRTSIEENDEKKVTVTNETSEEYIHRAKTQRLRTSMDENTVTVGNEAIVDDQSKTQRSSMEATDEKTVKVSKETNVDNDSNTQILRTSMEAIFDEKTVTASSNENVDVEDRRNKTANVETMNVIMKETIYLRRRSDSFPPPLASLARKSHSHFPTQLTPVQLHPIRGNGRILLHEVKSPPQSLFQPIRTQGRLVLQLIRQDDNVRQVSLETKEGNKVEECIAPSSKNHVLSTESKERPFQNVTHVTNPPVI